MGCDIHLYVEKREAGVWTPADRWGPDKYEPTTITVDYDNRFYTGRNYDLFAILADVRNGVGFAGIKTGGGFVPIAPPRGLPSDVTEVVRKQSDAYGHSHSYFTIRELLDYDWTQVTSHQGWVDVGTFGDWYFQFNQKQPPKEWCSGIGGSRVVEISSEQLLNLVTKELGSEHWWQGKHRVVKALPNHYTQLHWTESYYGSTEGFWSETIPRLLALAKGQYDDVRIVFWFDN